MNRSMLSLSTALLVIAMAPFAAHAKPGNSHSQHGTHTSQPEAEQPQPASHSAKPKAKGKAKIKRSKPCPPGLAAKRNGCLPPGQWRKGDQLPDSWVSRYVPYNSLPETFRSGRQMDPRNRYLNEDGQVVVVNPDTRTILDVIPR